MWNTICIEAFCMGYVEKGRYPCGKTYPNHFCLLNRTCPYLAWAQTTEAEVSVFASLKDILKLRFLCWWEKAYYTTTYLLWDKWRHPKWFDDMNFKIHEVTEDELFKKKDNEKQFSKWLEEVSMDPDHMEYY